jgi:hypothetical protein
MYFYGSELEKICSSRAAVVPYTIIKNNLNQWEIRIMLGVDKASNEITDLGGGVKRKTDLNNLVASFRELKEETKDLFGDYVTIEKLASCIAITKSQPRRFAVAESCDGITYDNGGMSVIFMPVDNEWIHKSHLLFRQAGIHPTNEDYNELSDILWVTENEFMDLVQGKAVGNKIMWTKLCKFYYSFYNKTLHDLLYVRFWWFSPKISIQASLHNERISSPIKSPSKLLLSTKISILSRKTSPCSA